MERPQAQGIPANRFLISSHLTESPTTSTTGDRQGPHRDSPRPAAPHSFTLSTRVVGSQCAGLPSDRYRSMLRSVAQLRAEVKRKQQLSRSPASVALAGADESRAAAEEVNGATTLLDSSNGQTAPQPAVTSPAAVSGDDCRPIELPNLDRTASRIRQEAGVHSGSERSLKKRLKADQLSARDHDAPSTPTSPQPVIEMPGRGRCAIATQPLAAGVTVDYYSSPPYAAYILQSEAAKRCGCCHAEARGKPLRPCPGCGVAHYCSAACRKAAINQHGHECAALADPNSPLSQLRAECDPTSPARFGSLCLAVRCLWRRYHGQQSADGHARAEEGGGAPPARKDADAHMHADFDAMMIGPTTAGDEALGEVAVSQPGFLPPGVGAEQVVAALGKGRVNSFSIAANEYVQHSPDDGGNQLIGLGCYPRAAILNHSCAPNCVTAFVGASCLVVRAASDVQPGTELCHSYADLCLPTRSETWRQPTSPPPYMTLMLTIPGAYVIIPWQASQDVAAQPVRLRVWVHALCRRAAL